MMDLIVDKPDLMRELAALQGCIASKPALAILANCKLEATLDGEHGMLHLTAADSDMAIRTSCPASVTRVGAIAVPGQKLYDYVRLLPDSDITIKQLEDGNVSISVGRSSATSAGSNVDDFPALSSMPSDTIELSGGALRNLIARTSYIVPDEGSRYSPSGAKLIIKPEMLAMAVTDGVQLAEVVAPLPINVTGEVTALISKKALVQLRTLIDVAEESQPLLFAQDDSTMFFQLGKQHGTRLFMANKVAGKFPDLDHVLPKYNGSTIVVNNSADFTNAVQRVAEYADSSSHAISLNVEGNTLSLSANSTFGESRDSVPGVEYSGEPITARFDASALLNFVKAAGTNDIRIDLKRGCAGQFRPEEGDDYTYRFFLMPMNDPYKQPVADAEKAA